MEYQVVTETFKLSFEEQITALLKEGWKLQEGASITYNRGYGSSELYFAQALIKEV